MSFCHQGCAARADAGVVLPLCCAVPQFGVVVLIGVAMVLAAVPLLAVYSYCLAVAQNTGCGVE